MKVTVEPYQSPSTQYRYVKCVAVLNKSEKLGIPRRYQKTWKVRTVAPEFSTDEMKSSFMAHAKRWEQQTLERLKNGQPPELKQEEIEV